MSYKKLRHDFESQLADANARREKLAHHISHRDEPLPPDFAEQVQERGNEEAMVALRRELDVLIESLHQALARIDDGSYGACAACGDSIGEPRLAALPMATLCVDCASATEGSPA